MTATAFPIQFDRESTTADVIAGHSLTGKLAVITGGSAGLGLQTAKTLFGAGADVFIGARSQAALDRAEALMSGSGGADVHSHPLDLMAPASVDEFADAVLALGRPVDILINNAGIMACPLARTSLGIESQLATNFVGHAQLTSRLSNALVSAGAARVVSLTSSGHHFSPVIMDDLNFEHSPYDAFVAYGQSKTACSLLAVKVSKNLNSRGVTAHAVHPGLIHTDLANSITDEDRRKMLKSVGKLLANLPPMKTIEGGAATSVWAATAPELGQIPALYLEDCQIAKKIDRPDFKGGVLPYALNEATADELWLAAEVMLGRPLPL